MNNEELVKVIQILKEENEKLKNELIETKEHLKKYTAPSYKKAYYENNKEEIKLKVKEYKEKTNLERYGVERPAKSQLIKNKIKETSLKKYGVEHHLMTKETKDKKKQSYLKHYGVEHPSQCEEIKNKKKETCMKNFGVLYPMQSSEVVDTIKKNNMEKYGVEHTLQVDEFREKGKQTCLKRYGVEIPLQCKEIMDKVKKTNMDKYGVEHASQCEEFKEKCKNTCLIKYGFEYATQTEEFKEKSKETCLNKYGVKYAMQNQDIMEKASKNAYKLKQYKFPSGKIIKVQGTEPIALDYLINNDLIDENDIQVGVKNVPIIWYFDDIGKKHRHYVDIFIPSKNLCIECKSTWTFNKKEDNIFLKQNAAKELGYNYEIWVYDGKGNLVEKHV
jgi:hypothetical protein